MNKVLDHNNKLRKGIDTIITNTSSTTLSNYNSSDSDSNSNTNNDINITDNYNTFLKNKIINNLNKIKSEIDSHNYSDVSDTCFIQIKSILDSDEENIIKININSDISPCDISDSSESNLSSVDGVSYID